MMEELLALDRALFVHINHDWANSVFDQIFPFITDLHRNPYFFFLVFPLLVLWVWKARMAAVKWILVLTIAIGLSDGFSYRVVKAHAQRSRPVETGLSVVLRTNHHSGTSFPSNHAANMFAGATVLAFAFPAWTFLFVLIATAVAYSRVYVGVHFPLDVTVGGLIGFFFALVTVKFAVRWWKLPLPLREPKRKNY
ncbi:MAG: phosphatase PAP2 family protein [Bdellovibrionota bacterium]